MDLLPASLFPLEAPRRRRTVPIQVLALGIGRSGTESLRFALKDLGYNETYHAWITAETQPEDAIIWNSMLRAKFRQKNPLQQTLPISAAEFDLVLGNCAAVTDMPAYVLAHELIAAYPEAKVILNRRADLDAWLASFDKASYHLATSWFLWALTSFEPSLCVLNRMVNMVCLGYFGNNFQKTGKQSYIDHYQRLEASMEPDKYLNWNVEDGWQPLCAYLDKPVPSKPFPSGNTGPEFDKRFTKLMKSRSYAAIRNIALLIGTFVATGVALWARY